MAANDISDEEAARIAAAWHSVMTWDDPGMAMYSVTSTGKIHGEEHRESLLAYVDSCMPGAREQDEEGEPPVLERHDTNVEELEAFKQWVKNFRIAGPG